MSLGNKIKSLREELRLSQDKLGEIASLNGRHISRIENGHMMPSIDVLKKIARALNTSLDYLAFDDIPKSTPLKTVFDSELFDLVQCLEDLPKSKIQHIKEIIRDLILANKASDFVQASKRPYNKKGK